MKKLFTLALAAATISAAYAVPADRQSRKAVDISNVPTEMLLKKSEIVAKSHLLKANDLPMVKAARVNPSTDLRIVPGLYNSQLNQVKNHAISMAAEGGEATPVYLRPASALFSTVNLEVAGATNPKQDGTYTLNLLSSTMPLGDATFHNFTYAIDGNSLVLATEGTSWAWTNWDMDNLYVDETSEEEDLTFYVNAPIIKDVAWPYPTLFTAAGESFTPGYTASDNTVKPLRYMAGGSLILNEEELADIAAQFAPEFPGAKVTASMGESVLNNPIADNYENAYYGTAFSAGTASAGFEDAPEITYSENSNAYWSAMVGSEAVQAAWLQEFTKPGSPMALSSIKMPFIIQAQEGAQLNFDFYTIEDGEMSEEPILSYTKTFEAAAQPGIQVAEILFTTKGDIDDLPFMLIDKAMLMVISGFNDEKFQICSPFVNMYTYNQEAPVDCEPMSIYTLAAYNNNGEIGSTIATPDYPLGGGTMNSFEMMIDASYPYIFLGPSATEENPENEAEVFNENTSANIVLKKPGDGAWAYLFFSGTSEDLENVSIYNYNDPEDESFWEWLEIGIDDTPQDLGQGLIQNPMYIYFGCVEDAAEVGDVTLALTYNGLVYPIHIGKETVGISNVTEAKKAELDWTAPVYNVMGQKVSEGYKGIAIQNGNKFIVK